MKTTAALLFLLPIFAWSAKKPNIVLIMADDMEADRSEVNNLAKSKPELVNKLA